MWKITNNGVILPNYKYFLFTPSIEKAWTIFQIYLSFQDTWEKYWS